MDGNKPFCARVFHGLPSQSTFICRVQSCVWRLPQYWPPSPLWVLPPHQRRGDTHSPGGEGDGGVNILEDARHRIGLLQYNLSTSSTLPFTPGSPLLLLRASQGRSVCHCHIIAAAALWFSAIRWFSQLAGFSSPVFFRQLWWFSPSEFCFSSVSKWAFICRATL